MSPRLVEIENRTEALEELYEKYEEIHKYALILIDTNKRKIK